MAAEELLTRAQILVITLPMALIFGAIAIKTIRDGEFGSKGETVGKEEKPLRFWFTVAFMVVGSAAFLLGVLRVFF